MLPLTYHRFPSGLELVLVEHRRAPLVALVVLYRVGSQDEEPSQAGIAHVVEHLAFGTSAYLGREEFDQYCSDAGGTNNAMTTYSYTLYTMLLPAYQLPLGLWLEGSRLRGLAFTDEEFRTQQQVILEELKETVYNQPYGRWREVQLQYAFAAGCPYHWEVYGTLETVGALTVEDARKFARQYYHPANAVLVICGDIDTPRALELAEQYLGEIPAPDVCGERRGFSSECCRGNVVAVLEDEVPLPAVSLAFHCSGYTAPEYFSLAALAGLLGGGRSSRLYRTFVLQSGCAREVGAFLDARQWASLLTCYAIASSPTLPASELEERLWRALRELCANGITAEEMERVRNQLRTIHAEHLQHPLGIAHEVAFGTAFWGDAERPFRVLEEYERLKPEEMVEWARRIFVPERAVTTFVLPHQKQ